MYLKEIKAHGFKSFADKISIVLTPGITGIVGPNGSGKSNVVDAIRWVLGEQSVKSLRGDGNMTEVIFSGSSSRNMQNVASVSLLFDNEDHYLPISFNEVSIKRRLYKDGSNEYFINNEKCRLKDIINLLLDSGMAKESFNIISQGKIDEILLSKPSDRRVILEEAAGVLKYKRRKEDSFRKLERTHENMKRIEDIILELEKRIEPLKSQKEKAELYQELYEKKREIDLSLLVYDISTLNDNYHNYKKEIETLNTEILGMNARSNKGEAKISEYKNQIHKWTVEIDELNKKLLELTSLTEKLNSKKKILLERKKYEVEDSKLHNTLISLKEDELNLRNQIATEKENLDFLKMQLTESKKGIIVLEESISSYKEKKQRLSDNLTTKVRMRENICFRIETLKGSIESGDSLPYAVRTILDNPKLEGIHNSIGNLIEVEEQYTIAISTALASALAYIVVDNEKNAKESIIYLKEKGAGRVTFFPLDRIQPKILNGEMLQTIRKEIGFVAMASDLVSYNPKYKNIIENLLGNVVVTTDIDAANCISKKCMHKIKIVTLDGDLFHIGGSITGGRQKKRNTLNDKYELERLIQRQSLLEKDLSSLEKEMTDLDHFIQEDENKLYIKKRQWINFDEKMKAKEHIVWELKQNYETVQNEITGASHILDKSLDSEEKEIMQKYYSAILEKDSCKNKLEYLLHQRDNVQDELEEYELQIRKETGLFKEKSKRLSSLEIEVNRIDVKLDHLLSYLSETYSMTYENAALTYKLTLDSNEAREELSKLKTQIKQLGSVNLEAITEYEKVSEHYEFLCLQKEDLISAENTLLDIIKEMDRVMIHEFNKTFKIIRENFNQTFKELFKGGHAHLILTDPNNLLETGIEIEACPPGKSLKSISLLSGGEKTFTAISLLFAILKSRPVPFCILDEIEAALDEANVTSFGEYLRNLKNKTQFILITHKKKTMEYADVLYGITMQESGVSKLVSVRLENLQDNH